MYVAKIRVSQHTCSLAYATRDGKLSMQILEYIILNDDDAVFLCRISHIVGNPKKYFDIIEKHESTKFLQILEKTPTKLDFIAVVSDTTGIKAFEESYCFVKPPIKVSNGNKYYTVFAPDVKHLKTAYEKLKNIGKWDVLEITVLGTSKPILTESQQKVLKVAYEMGYFSKRRNVNIDRIADAIGLSKSTTHKHLKDAISRVISDYIEKYEKVPEYLFV